MIWIKKPELRNALGPDDLAELSRQIEILGRGNRPFVLAGEGKMFCSGFDLRLCQRDPGVLAELLRRLSRTVQRMKECPVPIVVAARGGAIAGGCALLTGADIIVGDEQAKYGYPVTPLGLSPAVSAPTLARMIGNGPMRGRMLDPALIGGVEAARIGLVHELVVGGEEVLPRALAIARMLADKPPAALAATKKWVWEAADRLAELNGPGSAEASRLGLETSLASGADPECVERLAALRFK